MNNPLITSINEINQLLEKILSLYLKAREGQIVGSFSNSPLDTVYEESELLLFQNEISLIRAELINKASNFPVVTLVPPDPLPQIVI